MAANLAEIEHPGLDFFNALAGLTEQQTILLGSQSDIKYMRKGGKLRNQQNDQQAIQVELFLLQGRVAIAKLDEPTKVISAATPEAKEGLIQGCLDYQMLSLTDCKFISVPTKAIDDLRKPSDSTNGCNASPTSENVDQLIATRRHLLMHIYSDIHEDKLALPSLPDVAIQLQRLISSGKAHVKKIAEIINTDAAIAAKVIRVANSPLFHGYTPASTTDHALMRLGMSTSMRLVMSFAVENLFTAKSNNQKDRMEKAWHDSVNTSAISYVLAKHLNGFDPNHALLAGLMSELGALPIIIYAAQHPEVCQDNDYFEQTIRELKAEIGGMILIKWNFDEDVVNCVSYSGHWQRDTKSLSADLTDLILVAQAKYALFTNEAPDSFTLESMPAYNKLPMDQLSDGMKTNFFKAASTELEQAKAIFTR